ncbi:MAG: hypothetical protein IPK82_37025 [Polyangiaceae bacterium]|nr:hypothetical protein [Polyangiaceae bacterium]
MPSSLLEQLTEAARDDVLADPRWEDYAAGVLNAEDKASLLEKAKAAGLDEETIEALGPREAAFDEAIADAALLTLASAAESKGTQATEAPPKSASTEESATSTKPIAEASNVIALAPKRASRVARWVSLGGALAAAAAVVFAVTRPRDLPVYTMNIKGGIADVRATPVDTHDPVLVNRASQLSITLRPATKVDGRVSAKVFLMQDSTSFEPKVSLELAESGSIRITGTAQDWFTGKPAGTWQLCAFVGDPSKLPTHPHERSSSDRSSVIAVCRDVQWTGQ